MAPARLMAEGAAAAAGTLTSTVTRTTRTVVSRRSRPTLTSRQQSVVGLSARRIITCTHDRSGVARTDGMGALPPVSTNPSVQPVSLFATVLVATRFGGHHEGSSGHGSHAP